MKISFSLLVLASLLFSGCNKSDPTTAPTSNESLVVGNWAADETVTDSIMKPYIIAAQLNIQNNKTIIQT